MQIITHFVQFKPKYKLEKTSKFKFNKGTIATHSTIGDSQHRVILTFLTFLLSVVLTMLTLSHNTCHLATINCSFRLFLWENSTRSVKHMCDIVKTIHQDRS